MIGRGISHRRRVIAMVSVCFLLAACSRGATSSSTSATRPPAFGTKTPEHLPGILLFLNFGGSPFSTLWSTRPGSTQMVQISHSTFNIWSPAIAPDGSQIAFNRSRGPHHSDVLVLAKPDGSDQRPVHSLCGQSCTFFDEMTWTPDGQTLLMLMATGERPGLTGAIWSIQVDGSQRTQLTFPGPSNSEGGYDDHHPSVAPDGASFVFDRIDESNGRHSIQISSIEGGAAVVVPTPDDLNPGDPTWTPDGSRIMFQSPPEPAPGHAQNFYTILPDGTELQQITHYEDVPGKYVGVFHPCFSPDGQYFSASELRGNDRPGDIAIYLANGHRILRMPSPLIENNVVWGP